MLPAAPVNFDPIWSERQQALTDVVDDLIVSINQVLQQLTLNDVLVANEMIVGGSQLAQPATRIGATREILRWEALREFATRFRDFGKNQFEYFWWNFQDNHLEKSDEHPPEEVFRVILDQIAYDLEVILRAADVQLIGMSSRATLSDLLAKADLLTWLALEPAVNQQLLDATPAVLTYFQKSPHLRAIPYAALALVAVPYTGVVAARDLLAIPHEVGHYIFRHAYKPRSRRTPNPFANLRDSQQLAEWCCNWIEEIFADVYSCLIAGPFIALNVQDLQASDSQLQFTRDDGQHPVSALRPEIYLEVLERIGQLEWTEVLRARWAAILQQRGNPSEFMAVSGTSVPLEDARAQIKLVIDQLFAQGLNASINSAWWGGTMPSPANIPTPEEILTVFERRVACLELNQSPAYYQLPPSPTWQDWLTSLNLQPGQDGRTITIDGWQKVWQAEDWTTKSPENRWP